MFEDLEIGDDLVAGPRVLSALRAPADPAAVAAEVLAHWRESGVEQQAFVRHLQVDCELHQPGPVLDELTTHSVVVRLVPEAGGDHGRATWVHELRTTTGDPVATVRAVDLLRAHDATARPTHRDVGTLPWGRALAERLGSEPRFTQSVATWDGTLGLRSGDRTVDLRIYRGRIIEVSHRSSRGATFTFGADDRTWADVLTGPEVSFGVRLMRGDFGASGDPYEYLRLTRALEVLVETAQDLAAATAEVAR